MSIISCGKTDIGQKRSTNQDSIYVEAEHNLFVVADGMGGHNGGDIASQMSIKLFKEALSKVKDQENISSFLKKTTEDINNAIFEHGQTHQELKGMGTTITGIMFCEKFANITNIGDSRAYLIFDSMLFQLSKDHSLVQEKLNLNIYDREGARKDPQKNVLVRTVGFEANVEADVFKMRLLKNSIYMLCSDGLHGKVTDEIILKIIKHNIKDPANATAKQVSNAVNHLIAQANHNGGQDNISVIIAVVN